MGFYLQPGEPAADAIVRIIGELLDQARRELKTPQTDQDAAIHDVRKSMKKLRALLRLVRPVIRKKHFVAADRAIRDFARRLGGARDSAVVLATFDTLMAHYADFLNERGLEPLRQSLAERYQVAIEQHHAGMDAAGLVEDLEKLDHCFSRLDLGQFTYKTLLDSAKACYRDGRDALAALHIDPSTQQAHALRKHVKYLWYQMRLIQKADTAQIRQWIRELDELGELLGQDHDLALLAETLKASRGMCWNSVGCELVGGLIETRRIAILSQALRRADWLYAAKPKQFVSGLEKVSGTLLI